MQEFTGCPEVLAPAGDMERLRAAVLYGADAVYLASKEFGMRSAPANFDGDELCRAVEFAHGRGVRVYLTCNTIPRNDEVRRLPAFLDQAARAGVDALIVADPGVLAAARSLQPGLALHASTQAGVANYLAAQSLYDRGVRRVVLARELSLDEIAEIRRCTPPDLELETFVHGAMCMSVSGRCLISQYLAGRNANLGTCAQPCRWSYTLVEEKRPDEAYPISQDEYGSYILSANDLCMIRHLDKLWQAGVTSFKIEGRAKSAYYTAVATNAYRCATDLLRRDPAHYQPPPWLLEEVEKISHRPYDTGFYFGTPQHGQHAHQGGYVRRWDVAAVVEGWRDGLLRCSLRNRFFRGEALEALPPRGQPLPVSTEGLRGAEGEPLESAAHAMMKFTLPFARPLPEGTVLRRQLTP